MFLNPSSWIRKRTKSVRTPTTFCWWNLILKSWKNVNSNGRMTDKIILVLLIARLVPDFGTKNVSFSVGIYLFIFCSSRLCLNRLRKKRLSRAMFIFLMGLRLFFEFQKAYCDITKAWYCITFAYFLVLRQICFLNKAFHFFILKIKTASPISFFVETTSKCLQVYTFERCLGYGLTRNTNRKFKDPSSTRKKRDRGGFSGVQTCFFFQHVPFGT